MTSATQSAATVVAAHGRRGLLEHDGERRAYLSRGRHLRVVCGDRVRFQQLPGSAELVVTAIMPRTNALARCAERTGADEVIAANLTQLIAVCAPRPEADPFLLDRYLCAAELMRCRPALVWSKCDIELRVPAVIDAFRELGYPVIAISAHTGAGLPALQQLMAGHVSVLVGQSGVGKSSLINALVPGARAAIGELSAAGDTGTHTTTAVLMYDLGTGGRLVDTPGVRDFVPAFDDRRIDQGFPELRTLSEKCRFTDCRHLQEPGCAVKEALDSERLSARRYASYRRLVQMIAGRTS